MLNEWTFCDKVSNSKVPPITILLYFWPHLLAQPTAEQDKTVLGRDFLVYISYSEFQILPSTIVAKTVSHDPAITCTCSTPAFLTARSLLNWNLSLHPWTLRSPAQQPLKPNEMFTIQSSCRTFQCFCFNTPDSD